jgi:hypothetical protein
VGSGDGHGGARAHQLGQHLGTADYRDAALLRRFELRVARLHCAGNDEIVRILDVSWIVADEAGNAMAAEQLEAGALFQVAALHVVAAGVHHLGDGAHADAANAHDVEQACGLRWGQMHV